MNLNTGTSGILLAFCLPGLLWGQVTLDLSIQSNQGFTPQGNGGVVDGVVNDDSTVRIPLGRSTYLGGNLDSRGSTTGRSAGFSQREGSAGGTSIRMTVTPVTLFPEPESKSRQPELRPDSALQRLNDRVSALPSRRLYDSLLHINPLVRVAALRDVPKRTWSARSRKILIDRVVDLRRDEDSRVSREAAATLWILREEGR